MTNNRKFHLKPFSLSHHQSTMKVGTDAMILSAWVDVSGANKILDVGTGSGIISLLLASKSQADIDAVELDEASFIETELNFSQSPFFHRLRIFHADFNSFSRNCEEQYDLIISNPPFFVNDLRPNNEQKKTARHGDSLNYEQLCTGAATLLQTHGKLCVVLPYDESRLFLEVASEKKLHVQKQLIIFPKRGETPNRINLQMGIEKPNKVVTEKHPE